jgi:hypothetical protein
MVAAPEQVEPVLERPGGSGYNGDSEPACLVRAWPDLVARKSLT